MKVLALFIGLLACVSVSAQTYPVSAGVPYDPANYGGVYNFPNAGWTSGKPNDIWVTFLADCTNDIHVVFSPDLSYAPAGGDSENRYEIVIGGWGNSRSVIRRHLQGVNEVADYTPRCQSGVKSPFWARYLNGVVTVGAGAFGENTFLTYSDPSPLSVPYFDFSQWDSPVHYYDIAWGDSSNLPGAQVCSKVAATANTGANSASSTAAGTCACLTW